MVEVKSIFGGRFSSNCFLVRSDKDFMVDTGMSGAEELIGSIEEFIPDMDAVILTHRHIDHVGNAGEIAGKFDVPLYAHEFEAEAMRKGDETTLSGRFGKDIFPLKVKKIDFEGYSGFEIIHTPGHTDGSICLYHPDEKILFSGDTIFAKGGVGRSDLPTGDIDDLVESTRRLTEYDVDKIYPGHMSVVEQGGNEHVKRSHDNIHYL